MTRPTNPTTTLSIGDTVLPLVGALDLSLSVVPGRAAYAFSLPDPESTPFRAGAFVGDVAQGGSANCPILHFCAHGNGTHTEGVGHIVEDDVAVSDVVPYGPMPAVVLTVSTMSLTASGEQSDGVHDDGDRVVSARALHAAKSALDVSSSHLFAVVLRVDDARGDSARVWSGTNPPYFTRDACETLRAWGTHHVVLELPSLDREDDGGGTPAHHSFFGVPLGARRLSAAAEPRSVTELALIPASVVDGPAFLDLQVAPFHADAAPSRPMLFPSGTK